MNLIDIVKFGYILVIVTFILMIWASLSGAKEVLIDTNKQYPSCFFNLLCTCSKPVSDLGIVQCRNVPLFRVPVPINGSKVYALHLEDNGLRDLEPYFFQSTGLYRLVINRNPLQEIPEEAFLGLERSLWELELHDVDLTAVPTKSLRYLQKLRVLDLSGNDITNVASNSWRGLESSLQTLVLADNSIAALSPDGFSGLPLLESLDLRGNHLNHIDANVFRDGMTRLNKLILQDNQLTWIPYEELSSLKQLRYLDLSFNIIRQIPPTRELAGIRMSLDQLRLDNNIIEKIMPASFQYFNVLNTTVLDGNPLKTIKEDAFRQARIRVLSMRDCGLTELSPAAFAGLESSLQNLDLSGNNLTLLPRNLFHQFDSLRYLNLRENKVDSITPSESFNGFQFTLYHLDMSGKRNREISLQDLRRMRSLQVLSVGKLMRKSLHADDFLEFGVDLEALKITGSTVTKIEANAFKNLRTIKTLDLSENNIETIDRNAFYELGHGLLTLKLSNGLADGFTVLPADALRSLTQLQNLDISNNRIKSVPDTSFHFLGSLRRLELQDNQIEEFSKGTLQGDIHSLLESVILSFNRLRKIVQHTFVELPSLQDIALDDNLIEVIQRRSFMNLDSLKVISLRGNRLNDISDEAFQNLPALEELDLSFNGLRSFQFSMFDQVGTLSSLKVNASYNMINHLRDPTAASLNNLMVRDSTNTIEDQLDSVEEGFILYSSNIKILDLSHNNISYISRSYFKSAEVSLTHLYLSHNQLRNVTKDVFGNMLHLQWLDLSHNQVFEVEYDAFKNTNRLQILTLSHNHISELSPDMFQNLDSLRIVELADNEIRILPDNLFPEDKIERLDLSGNELTRIPTNSFSPAAAASLVQLDLSGNIIPAVAVSDLVQRYRNDDYLRRQSFDYDWQSSEPDRYHNEYIYHSVKRPNSKVVHQRQHQQSSNIIFQSLSWLDLSSNRLVRIEGGSFGALPKLRWLDLSNNAPLTLERGSGIFKGLERRLVHLGLRNASLSALPSLPWALKSLDLSHNDLPTLTPDPDTNMTQLRILDLSYNDLTVVPIVTHSLTELKWLSLSGNPITTLTNTSLYGVSEKLEYLDITSMQLKTLETGVFAKMTSLRTLKLTANDKVRGFNIPQLVSYNAGIKNLWIKVEDESVNLDKEMQGSLPCKLKNITFTGKALKYLSDGVFQGMHNMNLNLTIYNTSVTELNQAMFRRAGRVRNVTLDLRHNSLARVDNPSTGEWPGTPGTVFLKDISLAGNPLNCDCSLGWMEVWGRKRRQYFCRDEAMSRCMHAWDDLRMARCVSSNNRTLIDVLQNDIECGWNSAPSVRSQFFYVYVVVGALLATSLYI